MKTLGELMDEDDAIRLAQTKAEIAAEDAAWAKLPESEKLRILQEREAKANAIFDRIYEEEAEEEAEASAPVAAPAKSAGSMKAEDILAQIRSRQNKQ